MQLLRHDELYLHTGCLCQGVITQCTIVINYCYWCVQSELKRRDSLDDQTTDESVRINSRIYVSEIFCVSLQGDEAELSQKIASLKWHRRELQVSVVELELLLWSCWRACMFSRWSRRICWRRWRRKSKLSCGSGLLTGSSHWSKTSEHQQRPHTNRLKIATPVNTSYACPQIDLTVSAHSAQVHNEHSLLWATLSCALQPGQYEAVRSSSPST